MSPTELLRVAACAAVMFVSGMCTCDLICNRMRLVIGGPERALGAVAGSVAFSVALMVANIISGGAIFGSRWPVPVTIVALVVWRWLRREQIEVGSMKPGLPALVVAAAVVAIFVSPLVLGGRGVRTGDPPWHLGWTEQLLAGEPVPVGPAPDPYARNAYPWGVHAVLATTARAIPGAEPLSAFDGLTVLIAMGMTLGAACLARVVDVRAGAWAAGCTSLIGGFGWVQARAPDFSLSPWDARYGADLVVASPNSVYELFPPGLPRELGLVLLACAGLAFARKRYSVSGVLVGLTGLVSAPMFVAAVVWIIFGGIATRAAGASAKTIGIGFVTFGLWAGPVLRDFVRFSGFVDITPRLGREWPLHEALLSWGLLLPLALGGIVVVWRRKDEASRVIIGFTIGSLTLLILALLRAAFGWSLAGNATLLHQGRVWPHAHLLGAVLGGLALAAIWPWLSARKATALLAIGSVFAAASPALASAAVTRMLRDGESGFVYGTPDLVDGSFVRRAAAHLSPDAVLATGQAPALGFMIWQFSGCRLSGYDDASLAGNDLRIRFKDLAEQSGDQAERTEADLAIVAGVVPGALESGEFRGEEWSLIEV